MRKPAQILKRVWAVNPHEPRAWAYQAVLAHLRSDRDGEAAARRSALERWATNPEVDHLIGRKLSQKYRFAEGSAYQRRALELDPDYQPAKIQLCQDLLRLGQEDEGWKLAAEIFASDAYNVVAYNLTTLRDRLAGFQDARRAMGSSCGWSRARRNCTASGSWTCCGGRRRRSARSTG